MNRQEQITTKQNEAPMLECQYASRFYFNRAEKLSAFAFGAAAISVLSIFLPEAESTQWNNITLIVPILADIVAAILYFSMDKAIEKAATLRNIFDAIVLQINVQGHQSINDRYVREIILKALNHDKDKASQQMNNSGRNNPPGVKNWYEFSKKYSDLEAIHECQRQNIWWDKHLSNGRLVMNIILLIGVALILIYFKVKGESLLRIFLCGISFIATFFDRIANNIKYYRQSLMLEGISKNIDLNGNLEQIEHLQEGIEARREIPVLGINIFHRINSNKLSKSYEHITKK